MWSHTKASCSKRVPTRSETQLKDMVSSVEETLADKTDEVFMQIKRDYRAVLGGGDAPQGEVLPRVQRLVRKNIKKTIEGAERMMK